ncbi:uncharacterized protein LOC125019036 [Mugil cephalus]|uniref:uncharacterized protein LOC125019036 n=1 Tax=Mugil cephalus TaxID=48193 RepID=UPI001FB6F163|nr:uncharacterized protein LOC125019036 [Mugil cephalus]
MSSSFKSKPRSSRGELRRLLLAAEAGQKADILTYSSGHLSPRSMSQSQPHAETKRVFWRMSQNQEESPNLPTLLKRLPKAKIPAKKEEIKESASGATSVEPGVLGSKQDQTTDHSSHAERREDKLPEIVHCSSDSLPILNLKPSSQTEFNSSSDLEGKLKVCSSHSDQEGLSNGVQLEVKKWLGREVIAKSDLWAGINVAEVHERKLQKELSKLSAQSWPCRDRLAVFSDVFDDVCEGSPVFGRILREIKTDYDLYVNHLMDSYSTHHSKSKNTSPKYLSNVKVKQMELDDAEEEVRRLEQEARKALEENKRVRRELQNVPAITGLEDNYRNNVSLLELEDSDCAIDCTDSVRSMRFQVLSVWKEIQRLEEEIKEKTVSATTTAAIERRIKDNKTDIIKLIASNERLRTVSKDLENKINVMLNREKASKATRQLLWDKIHGGLPGESE